MRRLFAASLTLVSLLAVGCGDSQPHSSAINTGAASGERPFVTTVQLRVPAYSSVATTPAVKRNGRVWFAIAVNRELTVYRWSGPRWVLDGAVKLPRGMPPPDSGGGDLSFTSLTDGVAPDFEAHYYGADTPWYAFVARLRGRWQLVPFDDQYQRRDPFTFAAGAERHLVHGVFNACGCAGGPTTDQWYRFADGVFVATSPPGPSATCSLSALASAGHWPALPYDPLVRHIDQPFRPQRLACTNGWALATDGHTVGVYEQHGRHLDDRTGHRWLLVGIGSAYLIGTRGDFALPRSLLNTLGRRIGLQFPSLTPQPAGPGLIPYTRWQKAPITVRIGPAAAYETTGLFTKRPTVLSVKIHSRTGTRVTRFRWRSGQWVPSA
jgi:hypothetical protein